MSLESDTFDADLAALAWLLELGADEAIGEAPVNRFEAVETPPPPRPAAAARRADPAASEAPPLPGAAERPDTAALVASCPDLASLRATLEAFEECGLKKGAKSTVFADGNPAARVMIVGEAPGRDEDRLGLPFVGRSGQLLDRMLAAIGLSRQAKEPERAAYITNVLPWRPPQNRDPSGDEIAMLLPFLHRHIALAKPQVLILMGNAAAKTLLETTTGITRLRGTWTECRGIPAMPMFHPAALLRDPEKKRAAWADLLHVQERLLRP
ncbi:uracil-DNA glycosylase [Rhodobacteraceae bacterium DSL-40]|uniref:uracil-DNA glycosylase n=1 Tax=Amaricoccus sp. B4 TaxID=3368557 RepID=UPI000DABD1FA